MSKDTKENTIVKRKIGKIDLEMKESHQLPFYYERHPFYDRALSRICEKINEIDGYLSVIDVGANIGDSVSLISEKTDGSFLCIEGDEEYLPLLKNNLSKLKDSEISIEEGYCVDVEKKDENFKIERAHGTAKIVSTTGEGELPQARFRTLDEIIKQHSSFEKANVMKIDTDGFEINVLKGGEKFIKKSKPVLFFEYTPELYLEKKQDPLYIFEFLEKNGYSEALMYDNFGRPIEIIDTSNKVEIEKWIGMIDNKSIYYYDVLTYHHSKKEKYSSLFKDEYISSFLIAKSELDEKIDRLDATKIQLESTNAALDATKIQLESTNAALDATKIQLESTNATLNATKDYLESAEAELHRIYSSREWKLILKLRRIIKAIIPAGSARRKIAVGSWRLIKAPLRLARKMKNGALNISQPKKRRKINLKSNKIIYIGHSYHNKTKSTVFLIDYLKQLFDVEVVSDESWLGKPAPDFSFINESYLGVIFFQTLPSSDVLKNIKNDNIIYFPMYDQSGRLGRDFWDSYRSLKIANFSKTLHEKLSKWGFESMYVQYFPDSQEFIPGNADEVFFWQRLTHLNISTITKLFGKEKAKIHIHKAIDPGQQYVAPSEEDEKKFRITYSDWFETREEMWDMIKQKGIYVAPREYEGIGMSFLEAMAMGKAVVAVDNPTMNEYIENGKNGYLFDFKNPKQIDLSKIEQVQKNAFEFMQYGRKKWERDKHRIIDFIKKL